MYQSNSTIVVCNGFSVTFEQISDIVALTLWTIAGAFYGLFFAIPLRKHFVIRLKLVFPSPTAAAETIKVLESPLITNQYVSLFSTMPYQSLHSMSTSSNIGIKKAK